MGQGDPIGGRYFSRCNGATQKQRKQSKYLFNGSFHVRSPQKNKIRNGTPTDFDKIVYTSSL